MHKEWIVMIQEECVLWMSEVEGMMYVGRKTCTGLHKLEYHSRRNQYQTQNDQQQHQQKHLHHNNQDDHHKKIHVQNISIFKNIMMVFKFLIIGNGT